ncbi:hypothetical protein CRM22_009910 [Opisthorchis felineus]|uniref:Uncharacterized protein n=1 Tax=Opisthorchis felineus TaxID=147828 RepID=A0A4S2L4L0_OPIFE|nr:hypothetical protein CRM22_009910 [Opisthorchis felineus]
MEILITILRTFTVAAFGYWHTWCEQKDTPSVDLKCRSSILSVEVHCEECLFVYATHPTIASIKSSPTLMSDVPSSNSGMLVDMRKTQVHWFPSEQGPRTIIAQGQSDEYSLGKEVNPVYEKTLPYENPRNKFEDPR